ncbi:hypothetical protein BDQ17DRAFT_1373466 [Cyathus striatus]|nr:hypothetical protein BDQ17DRAFT_1373466 [Cyathus striatus]
MGFVARITIGPQLTLSLITILVTLFLPLKTSITTIRIPSRIFFRTLLIASTMTSIEPRRTRCVFAFPASLYEGESRMPSHVDRP